MQWVVCDVDFIKQVIISIVNKLLDGEGCIRKAPPPSLAKRSVKPRYVTRTLMVILTQNAIH